MTEARHPSIAWFQDSSLADPNELIPDSEWVEEVMLGGAMDALRPSSALRRSRSAAYTDFETGTVTSKREQVRQIQVMLNRVMGLRLAPDGFMGPLTRSAIRSFQRRSALTVDGIAGHRTQELLRRAYTALSRVAPGPRVQDGPAPTKEESSDESQTLRKNLVALAEAELSRWRGGAVKEDNPRIHPVLMDYWLTGVGWAPQRSDWWIVPWSAVFISWLMRRAGAGPAFRYSAAHTDYVAQAKRNRIAGDRSPFRAYRLEEAAPRPGDIVCMERKGPDKRYSGLTYDNVDRCPRASHCDIVTAIEPGKLLTVGGNVSNSVAMTPVDIDHRGFIIKPHYYAVVRVGV